MNYLWGGMILVGVVYAAMTGNLGAVTDQALASAKEAVSLCLTMTGAMAFWVGLMKIAEKGGMVNRAASALGPLLGFLFPSVPENSAAGRYMATNMVSNFLGLGWAATPAGISAMKELKRLQKMSNQATDAMCDFLIINISSLQLIPVNIIAYRSQYGAVSPAAIVGPAIIATSIWEGGKMNLILYLSEAIIPILVLLIVGNGLMHRQHVYEDFLEGAKSGIRTAVEIMPTLVGLMAAVGILRASGFLDFVSGWLGKLLAATGFPTELIPVAVVKMFSSSAATGLLLDIYKTHGTDSMLGRAASIMLSSTETIFYTMSVYFMSVKVKKTRYTLPGALVATAAGIAASVFLVWNV